MLKGNDVIGKPVIAFDSGKEIEKIKDIIFDQDANRVLAFVVDEGGWFSEARVIPWAGVKGIGADALIAHSDVHVVPAANLSELEAILARGNVLDGTTLMTTDGQDLGAMKDLYFDGATGRLEGYEVSGGIFADMSNGRSFVPAPDTLSIGDDVAFVPTHVANLMQEQTGGVQAVTEAVTESVKSAAATTGSALSTASEVASNAAVATGQKLQEAGQVSKEKLIDAAQIAGETLSQAQEVAAERYEQAKGVASEATAAATERVQAATENVVASTTNQVAKRSVEQAKGRRAINGVRTDDGYFIVAIGQIVNDTVLARAVTYNKETRTKIARRCGFDSQ